MIEMNLNLPLEFINFLETNKELDYNPDEAYPKKVKFHKLEDLKREKIWIDATTYDVNLNIINVIQQAYYELEAVSLIEECDRYSEFGILCWLPELKKFCSWDIDHWVLTLFPNATWEYICNDPVSYLNAQWEEDYCGVGEIYDPSGTLPLIIGQPFE